MNDGTKRTGLGLGIISDTQASLNNRSLKTTFNQGLRSQISSPKRNIRQSQVRCWFRDRSFLASSFRLLIASHLNSVVLYTVQDYYMVSSMIALTMSLLLFLRALMALALDTLAWLMTSSMSLSSTPDWSISSSSSSSSGMGAGLEPVVPEEEKRQV